VVRDCAENGFGIAARELREEDEGFDVGAQVEEIARMDLAGHDGVGRAGFFQNSKQFSELADAQPFEFIDERRERGVGLILKSGGGDPRDARGARGAGHGLRVGAVAGDDRECLRSFQSPRI